MLSFHEDQPPGSFNLAEVCPLADAIQYALGFARVVPDFTVFSWPDDLVIAPDSRGRGLGQWMCEELRDGSGSYVRQIIS